MTEIPVLVSIHSCARRDDDSEEPISMMVGGVLQLDEEKAVIIYQEVIDESIPPQTVVVTAKDDTVTLHRQGDYATEMAFCRGLRYEGNYNTPYGGMDMAIFCTRLSYDLSDIGGGIELEYQMDLNGQFAGMHQLHLEVAVKNG